jgi:hypothetical protein
MANLSQAGYQPSNPQKSVEYIQSNPNQQLGLELDPKTEDWSLAPEFYPDDFTQMKKKEFSRYGGDCGGETVTIKSVKNREFHLEGVILQGEINLFQGLLDLTEPVDLLSPLTPVGGMECHIKQGELGSQDGWDPHNRQWMFKYTLDLISTGRDEYDTGQNSIVTAITNSDNNSDNKKTESCTYTTDQLNEVPRSEAQYFGEYQEEFELWQSCQISSQELHDRTGDEQVFVEISP